MGTGAKKARPVRPVKPLTAAQHRLIEAVDFSKLDPIELSTYHDYMAGREIVRQETALRRSGGPEGSYIVHELLKHPASPKAPIKFEDITQTRIWQNEDWLAPRVKMIRKAYHLSKELVAQIPGNPTWFLHPSTRVLVSWPEWPSTDYFKIPRDERLRRIKMFPEPSEQERLAAQAYLINPHNPSTAKIAIVTIAILDQRSASGPEQLEAVKAELQCHDSELFKRRRVKSALTRKQGRASEKIKITYELTGYAAYLLCEVGKIPPAQAIPLIHHPAGTGRKFAGGPAYSATKELLDASRHFSNHLHEFRAELMASLVPLGLPLNPGEMSRPDWSQLDAAKSAYPEPQLRSKEDLKALNQPGLDTETRKTLENAIWKSIAQLDRELRQIGAVEDRAALDNAAQQVQGIIHRIPRKN